MVEKKEIDLSSCPNDSANIFNARLDDLYDEGIVPNKDRFMTAVR